MLTTHYMDEAQALADRIVVIADGVVVATGTPDDLGGRDTAAVLIRFRRPAGVDATALPVPVTPGRGGIVEIATDDEVRMLHTLTGWALDVGIALENLTVTRPTLEDVYLTLTEPAAGTAPAAAAASTGAPR